MVYGPVHTGDKVESCDTVDFLEFDKVDRMSKVFNFGDNVDRNKLLNSNSTLSFVCRTSRRHSTFGENSDKSATLSKPIELHGMCCTDNETDEDSRDHFDTADEENHVQPLNGTNIIMDWRSSKLSNSGSIINSNSRSCYYFSVKYYFISSTMILHTFYILAYNINIVSPSCCTIG